MEMAFSVVRMVIILTSMVAILVGTVNILMRLVSLEKNPTVFGGGNRLCDVMTCQKWKTL